MKYSLFTFPNYKLQNTGTIFQNPLVDTMISPIGQLLTPHPKIFSKVNPQARYSAVAEAVALADAEDRGEIQQAKNTDINQQVIRRRSQQPRPLSTFINGSADSHNLTGHNETNQQINSFQRDFGIPVTVSINLCCVTIHYWSYNDICLSIS